MTRYAIFSDIHNHSQALAAMLGDAGARQVDGYVCLGDIGIDSCVDQVRGVGAEAVFGNWELSGWRGLAPANQRWAGQLPPLRRYAGFWVSHAAPTWPSEIDTLTAYLRERHRLGFQTLFPYYLQADDTLWRAFAALLEAKVPLLFHGHTHRQIVWTLTPDNDITRSPGRDFTLTAGHSYVIGVGSVGQPRDSASPSYVIFDSITLRVQFVRLQSG